MAKKVLIIEDDASYQKLLVEKLGSAGFTTLAATNGSEGIKEVTTHTDIDLIILDILMPHMDGITFFHTLRTKLGKTIPVIILTNLSNTAYPSDSLIKKFLIKANTSLEDVVSHVKETMPPQ